MLCRLLALTPPGNLPTYLPPLEVRLKKCSGKGYVIVPRRVSPYLSPYNMVRARFLGVKFAFPQVEVVVVVVGVAMVMVVVVVVVVVVVAVAAVAASESLPLRKKRVWHNREMLKTYFQWGNVSPVQGFWGFRTAWCERCLVFETSTTNIQKPGLDATGSKDSAPTLPETNSSP